MKKFIVVLLVLVLSLYCIPAALSGQVVQANPTSAGTIQQDTPQTSWWSQWLYRYLYWIMLNNMSWK